MRLAFGGSSHTSQVSSKPGIVLESGFGNNRESEEKQPSRADI